MHTPGPWQPMFSVSDEGSILGPSNDENSIAVIAKMRLYQKCSKDLQEQADANIRLIAAAPELLAALSAIVDGWDNWSDKGRIENAIDAARAAIAKATA